MVVKAQEILVGVILSERIRRNSSALLRFRPVKDLPVFV